MKVLVIDDEPFFLERAKRILSQLGADVHVHVHIGWRGSLFAARMFGPDLILLDLNMPGMSGSWLLAELRKQCPSTRFFFYSDSEPGSLRRLARSVGADGAISKSELGALTSESLRAMVERKIR